MLYLQTFYIDLPCLPFFKNFFGKHRHTHTHTHTHIGPKYIWSKAISRAECDTSAGEVYMKGSPGKVSSLDKCKKSCKATRGCRSITFFKSGYCSLYSTPCTGTKRNNKAEALLSLIKQTDTTATTPKTTPASTPNATCAKEFHFVDGKCKSCPQGYTCDGTKWATKTKNVCSKGLVSTPLCFACPYGHECANGLAKKTGTLHYQPLSRHYIWLDRRAKITDKPPSSHTQPTKNPRLLTQAHMATD